jgi:16S rRNA (cytosine967-C5)-methyltransferase
MHILQQHLEHILARYTGSLPLHHFLKEYFRQHPKLGSRDRRGLSDAAYAWMRAGKALEKDTHNLEEKRLAAMQLCGLRPKAFAPFFPPDWSTEAPELPADFHVALPDIFPFDISLSSGISREAWTASLLRQPRLFLRIRGSQATTEKILQKECIPHEWLGESCLALPNATKLEGLLPEDSYVVQDASSQACGALLQGKAGERWWDCCAGAGGKSLMLADSAPGISLLATDVRASILKNLAERFRRYGLPLPERAVLNASDAQATQACIGERCFEGIICDVPCSGSGTWARTPESCCFFQPEQLASYASRQRDILKNAARFLSPGGRIIYITCSVFHAENEDVLETVAEKAGLRIVSAQLFNGISRQADSLFAAELRRI